MQLAGGAASPSFRQELGCWGDKTRRHASIEADGSQITKLADDYQPSTAISRVPAFINFFAEIKIVKCMRGTAVGLVVPTIELDQAWSVSRILKKERDVRQRALEEALQVQNSLQDAMTNASREVVSEADATGGAQHSPPGPSSPAGDPARRHGGGASPLLVRHNSEAHVKMRRKALEQEFERREHLQEARKKVLQCNQSFNESDSAIRAIERRVLDRWGPRLWYLTCDGLFGAGADCRETGATFTDGDVVRVELENNRLIFSINGKEILETVCKVQTRTFLAVCLQNKGACVEMLNSSLTELLNLQSQESAEAAEEVDRGDVESQEDVTELKKDEFGKAKDGFVIATGSPTSSLNTGISAVDSTLLSPGRRARARVRALAFTSGKQITQTISAPMILLDEAQQSFQKLEKAFAHIFEQFDQRWETVERSLRAADVEGSGKISKNNFLDFMKQYHVSEIAIDMSYHELWRHLDEDGEDEIDYSAFIEEVIVAAEGHSCSQITWQVSPDDFVVDPSEASITATGSRGRTALVSKVFSKGMHKFEFHVRKMSGTIFVGILQASRSVSTRGSQKIVDIKTRPAEDNWYYAKDTGGFSAWYISDIGVIRRDSTTLAQTKVEISTGDTVKMEIDFEKKELQFYVRGKPAGPVLRDVKGDFYPAVFVAGDAGDCVILKTAETYIMRGDADRLLPAWNSFTEGVDVVLPAGISSTATSCVIGGGL
jgi:Ca2+-binding EF-hand superfamily protein